MAMSNTAASRKVNRNWLPLHAKFLNFNAKSGSGETISPENRIVAENKTASPSHSGEEGRGKAVINEGIPQINNAWAGVGTPINESLWRASILNFARRMADKTVNARPIHDHAPAPEAVNKFFIKIPGNTPKLTISASESSSLPMELDTFNILALKPSKKSNTQADQTNQAVGISGLVNEQIIPTQPHNKFPDVNALGMWRSIILSKG